MDVKSFLGVGDYIQIFDINLYQWIGFQGKEFFILSKFQIDGKR